jgi:hypothetical protein
MNAEQIAEIEARANDATQEPLKRNLYDHGGGRMLKDGEAGSRWLVVDAYNEADREFYFGALADVKALIAALRAAQARVAELEVALRLIREIGNDNPYDTAQSFSAGAMEFVALRALADDGRYTERERDEYEKYTSGLKVWP